MKFIPLESFDSINSLMQGVEALGCLLTLRLEAFTCRHTKEERLIASNIATYQANVQLTPPMMYIDGNTGEFAVVDTIAMIPPLQLGGREVTPMDAQYGPVSADDIDDRLVFLVAALNSLYGEDGYDFSILTERDFTQHSEATVRAEVQLALQALPEQCGPAVRRFWAAIEEVVLTEAQGCEYFEFVSPTCNPLADTTVFTHHYFLYNRKKKVLVALIEFGEGNLYRGDDGLEGSAVYSPESPLYRRRISFAEEASVGDAEGKNRGFYGY